MMWVLSIPLWVGSAFLLIMAGYSFSTAFKLAWFESTEGYRIGSLAWLSLACLISGTFLAIAASYVWTA